MNKYLKPDSLKEKLCHQGRCLLKNRKDVHCFNSLLKSIFFNDKEMLTGGQESILKCSLPEIL